MRKFLGKTFRIPCFVQFPFPKGKAVSRADTSTDAGCSLSVPVKMRAAIMPAGAPRPQKKKAPTCGWYPFSPVHTAGALFRHNKWLQALFRLSNPVIRSAETRAAHFHKKKEPGTRIASRLSLVVEAAGIYPRTKKPATGSLFARCGAPSCSLLRLLATKGKGTNLRLVPFPFGGGGGN